MDYFRQIIDVKNNSFNVSLPNNFKAKKVEIIVLPSEEKDFKLSAETKKMLDERLEDYFNNKNDVEDFDKFLDELEREL